MKLFYKLNLLSLLLGFVFYLLCILLFREYDIQHKLNLSENVISIFYIIVFLFMSIIIPLLSDKWLNGSRWSLILTILWVPYLFICIFFINRLFPTVSDFSENNYGAAIISFFLIISFPIYIFILSFIGICFNRSNK